MPTVGAKVLPELGTAPRARADIRTVKVDKYKPIFPIVETFVLPVDEVRETLTRAHKPPH